jgi:Rrf2 family protein
MISKTAQYALRALIVLAQHSCYVPGRNLSNKAEIPPNYLAKIMLSLRGAGFVRATRGKAGGYQLARSPVAITLLEVVELFDPAAARYTCLLGLDKCSGKGRSSHYCWPDVQSTKVKFLKTTTLARIATPLQRRTSPKLTKS